MKVHKMTNLSTNDSGSKFRKLAVIIFIVQTNYLKSNLNMFSGKKNFTI